MNYEELQKYCSLPQNRNKPICRGIVKFDFLNDFTIPQTEEETQQSGLDYDPSVIYPDEGGGEDEGKMKGEMILLLLPKTR